MPSPASARTASSITATPHGHDLVGGQARERVYLHVLRAWGLTEGLGGCNPYVVLDWGNLGSSTTPTVQATTTPHFSARLAFRSPVVDDLSAGLLAALDEGDQVVWRDGKQVTVYLPPLKVLVYSRNVSVCDELVGEGEVTAAQGLEMITAGGTHTFELLDSYGQHAGYIEMQFDFE